MIRGWMIRTVAGVVVGCAGVPAMADGFAFNFAYAGHHHHHHGHAVGVGVVVGRPAVIAPAPVVVAPPAVVVAPAPVVVAPRPVYVPPVYSTVTERVWVPTTTTAYRDVAVIDSWGRSLGYRGEAYSVPGGYWSLVTRRVLVHEGYWTTPSAGPAPEAPQADENYQPQQQSDEDYGNVDYGSDSAEQNGYQAAPQTYRSTAPGFSTYGGASRASAIR